MVREPERRTRERVKEPPYPPNTPEEVAWWRGYYDRQSRRPFEIRAEPESVTLAYAHGWKAGAR